MVSSLHHHMDVLLVVKIAEELGNVGVTQSMLDFNLATDLHQMVVLLNLPDVDDLQSDIVP